MSVNTLGVCNAQLSNKQVIEVVVETLTKIGLNVDKVRIINVGAATINFTDADGHSRNMWLFFRHRGDTGPQPGGPQVVWDTLAGWERAVEFAETVGAAMAQYGPVWICDDTDADWRALEPAPQQEAKR